MHFLFAIGHTLCMIKCTASLVPRGRSIHTFLQGELVFTRLLNRVAAEVEAVDEQISNDALESCQGEKMTMMMLMLVLMLMLMLTLAMTLTMIDDDR